VGYQIAFDLVDKENQAFNNHVISQLTAEQSITEKTRLSKMLTILKGEVSERLNLQWLKKNNATDMLLLNQIKDTTDKQKKNSMIHASIVWCNGAMNAYTTNDAFLRDNIGWVSLSTNWNRFSATSSLGLIHTGNKEGAMEVLRPYLRGAGPDGQPTSPYSQGGAYYAYGLIHANKFNEETSNYLTQEF